MKNRLKFTPVFYFILFFLYIPVNSEEQYILKDKHIKTVFDFNDSVVLDDWVSVNDGVMGGISVGKASIEDSTLVFTGFLSLENNGGFSSIRTIPSDLDLSDYSGFKIKVKGDGRKYQFRIRTDDNFDGIAYRAEFETINDEWVEVELPFELFKPTYRGRDLNNVPPIDPAEIKQIGFLIADKKESEFRLAIDSIIAF